MESTDHAMQWPFDQQRNCATVFSKSVLDQSRPILFVSHDEEDHAWQFLHGISGELEDLALAALFHVLEIDPGMAELATLKPGFHASRAAVNEPWVIERTPPDPDDAMDEMPQ